MKGLRQKRFETVVMGVSAGGFNALQTILPALESPFALSVMIVQHLWRTSDGYVLQRLSKISTVTVKEAEEKERLEPGTIYLAPPNYHLLVEKDKTLSLSVDGRVNYSRPSVDVLFESAADVFGPRLIGVVLTGANKDGSQGLKAIKEAGGLAIVQDPATAEVGIMPQAALDFVKVDYVLPLEKIGPFLVEIAKKDTHNL
ncbi:MAG: chemotaxis protein CheB [SAR324 cluster bacterium]|nr:chemotaxis protein CheB [SAR324 cluster bacterium]